MELLGIGVELFGFFVTFGLLVGILFGFFGMGGSFLITPALLVMGYPTPVAVGSGMAFVFGTAVIATLKHHDLGQVDYKLGVIMIAGTTLGIEVGRILVYYLEDLGLAGGIISTTYVVLLGGIGLFVVKESLGGNDDETEPAHGGYDGNDSSFENFEPPEFAKKMQAIRLWPMVTLRGDVTISAWIITAIAFITGLLSGFLGVGGGFIRMPAMMYAIGVPVPVAVGTDLFEIVFSGGLGSFLYAREGGVDLSIVVPLLLGSALGARVGSASTEIVDSGGIKIYFGIMLLLGSIAVAVGEIGEYLGNEALEMSGLLLIVGSAFLVSGAIIYSTIRSMRSEDRLSTSAD
ncbi:sulfite exporter TauE/SafE family protein [Natrialbaceae archaeon A-CW2]|uniref:sulfite exporter TauE/SafE family protein n=1 Tax=Natronosalvus amylolyticus TaxID=2961994 RepID=UPI0020CA11E7|nr:sulfite exporter TauE/SafE family protein [Natronosalvus amylolyticus]